MSEVQRVFANGKVEVESNGKRIRFNPQKVDPLVDRDRMQLTTLETVKIHEGDHARWTANDKNRGINNAAMATVTAIEGGRVTVELAFRRR